MPKRNHDDDDLLSPRGAARLRDELAGDGPDGKDTAWPKVTGVDAYEGQKDFGMGKLTGIDAPGDGQKDFGMGKVMGITADDDWEPQVDLSDLGVEPLSYELKNSQVLSYDVVAEPDADPDGDDLFDDLG